MRELTNSVRQRYRMNTRGRTPHEIQQVLERKGIKGFVVRVDSTRVTMLVDKKDVQNNRRNCNGQD